MDRELGWDNVSILLTTWDVAAYLRQTVDSYLTQTYRNLEIIVVDGGSTDGTYELLECFAGRINYAYGTRSSDIAR